MSPMHCRFCRSELDLAQQFAYLVESQTVDNPVMLAAIRRLPHAGGVPLRVCRGCQTGIEQRRLPIRLPSTRPAGQLLVLAAVAFGFGFLTSWLAGPAQ